MSARTKLRFEDTRPRNPDDKPLHWFEGNEPEICAMWSSGTMTAAQIGRHYGVSRDAVIGFVNSRRIIGGTRRPKWRLEK